MAAEHGTPAGLVRNFFRSSIPLPRRIVIALRNTLRRVWPRPATCCGHYGEPGC